MERKGAGDTGGGGVVGVDWFVISLGLSINLQKNAILQNYAFVDLTNINKICAISTQLHA